MQPREYLAQWRQSVLDFIAAHPEQNYEDVARQFQITPAYVGLIARTAGIYRRRRRPITPDTTQAARD